MSAHKTIHDYGPVVRSMTADAFAARYNFPFLFGREVLEEEFQFSTVVTDERGSLSDLGGAPRIAGTAGSTDVFRIRHWVIAIKKKPDAPAQDRIFLGRSETNDISVPHKTVSKLHAYFQREAVSPTMTKWSIADTGSSNGTKHNGLKLPPRAKVQIYDSDTLVFGRCVFQWMSAKSLYDRVMAFSG